jgi:hypothetical protein
LHLTFGPWRNETPASDLIRKYFSAYENKNRKAVESLLSNDFLFTSPYDYRIDRETYFKRSRPHSEQSPTYEIASFKHFLRKQRLQKSLLKPNPTSFEIFALSDPPSVAQERVTIINPLTVVPKSYLCATARSCRAVPFCTVLVGMPLVR